MKNKILIILASLFISTGLSAQNSYDSKTDNAIGINSLNEAAELSREIVAAAGVKANFAIAEANVPNAVAVLHGGERFILYNPRFINKLTHVTGTRWAAISVLAHEIGHHLYNATVNRPAFGMATELEADLFSGYVLQKMGATLTEAQAAMNTIAYDRPTRTHPGKGERIGAIDQGWRMAGGVTDESSAPVSVTNVFVSQQRRTVSDQTSVLSSNQLVARILFNANPDNQYFLTKELTVVKVDGKEISTIARIRRSGDEDFPFIISDDTGYKVYVSSNGDIVSGRGLVLGKMISV